MRFGGVVACAACVFARVFARVVVGVLVGVVGGGGAACVFDDAVSPAAQITCTTSDDCPRNTACVVSVQRCVPLDEVAGERCGDGIVAASGGEECDDGADNSDDARDACRSDCTKPRCGDGVVDTAEGCDDGNDDDDDACRSDCAVPGCGDGVVDDGEACDDGNDSFDDACLPSCVANKCGDGFLDGAAEDCDDHNDVDEDFCKRDCTLNVCGDGIKNPQAEACDDGNIVDDDDCTSLCARAVCGDGVTNQAIDAVSGLAREECDDGNVDFDDDCLPNCHAARCGDGFVRSKGADPELCDDGNESDLDACLTETGLCVPNVCGDGILNTGAEACDDGNAIDEDDCTRCARNFCGDGVVNVAAEECDDGNFANDDDCLVTCTANVCGDGFVASAGGAEDCDDGNTTSFDGCSATCSVIIAGVDVGAPIVGPPAVQQSDLGTLVSVVTFDPTAAATDPATASRIAFVNVSTGELSSAPLPLPSHLPAIAASFTNNRAGAVTLDDGSASVFFVSSAAVDAGPLADPYDAGFDNTVGHGQSASFAIDVIAATPSPTGAVDGADGGPAVPRASASLVLIGLDADGTAWRAPDPEDGRPAVFAPPHATSTSGAIAAPTLVLDHHATPIGAFAPAAAAVRYFSFVDVPGPGPGPDAGFVPCGDPQAVNVQGDVVGQVALTDRAEAWVVTANGFVVRMLLDIGPCPPTLTATQSVQLPIGTAHPLGSPAVTVDPVLNIPVLFEALDDGRVVRVVYPDSAQPSVTAFTITTAAALITPVVVNSARDVFVGDAAGVLHGVRLTGDVVVELLAADLGAPLAGPPRIVDQFLVAATTDGRIFTVERAGQATAAAHGSWGTPLADDANTSAGFAEPLQFELNFGCASTPAQATAQSAAFLLCVALVTRRRRRHAPRSASNADA